MKTILHYRKIIWTLIALLLFIGIFTYVQLPKRDIPEITQELASISIVYPGANPEEVERSVTNPLEEALTGVDGVSEMASASTTGFANITVMLESGVTADTVYSNIRQVVADTATGFPTEVRATNVNTDLIQSNVATYHLLTTDQEELANLRPVIEEWEASLNDIAGVEGVQIKGLPEQTLMINIDPDALASNQMQPNEVIQSVSSALAPIAIGTETADDQIYQLSIETYQEIEDLARTFIKNDRNNDPIYLTDVATLSVENQAPTDVIRYQDQYALSLTVQANAGVNIVGLQDQITTEITALSETLPETITVDQFFTQSTVIDEVFSNLISSFVISLVSVFVIMVLGLPISSAVLVALAIPLSIVIGLIPLPYSGVDLNQISIIGMIVAIGILVDDAIVVNDNIQRRFQLGDSARIGTIKGVREVAVSIVTSTLLIVFSFFPLTFLSGGNGDFIRALPLALIFTVVASTIIALTLIPTIRYTRQKYLGKTKTPRSGLLGGFFEKAANLFADKVIPATLKKPWLTILGGLIITTFMLLLAFNVPFEFFPSADRAEVTISARFSQGTTLESSQQSLEEMEAYLLEHAENISETVTYTGGGLPGIFNSSMTRTGTNTGQLVVRVDRDETTAQTFINEWEKSLRDAFPEGEIFLTTIVSGPPTSSSLQVDIQGPEIDQLVRLSEQLKEELGQLATAKIITTNTSQDQPFIDYDIDTDFLAEQGLMIDQVIGLMQLANTGIPLGTFDNGIDRLPIQLYLDDGNPNGLNLEALQLAAFPEGEGTMPAIISLDTFITSETTEKIGAIPHVNGKRTITIEGYEEDGENQAFLSDADTIITAFSEQLPDGYQIIQSGSGDVESDFFLEVAKLFMIVLFLIYLTLAIQFNSLLTPMLITSTIVLAVAGAVTGLFISGEPLSFLAVLGIVALSGIVVRNSILLIEFIEKNRTTYDSDLAAIIEAGRARFRPILLTTLTSMAALTPIIFTGDVLFRPLAISIVYGIFFATTLTLLLLPAFYTILSRVRK